MTTDDPRPARERYAGILAMLDEDIWTPEKWASLAEEVEQEARLKEVLNGVLAEHLAGTAPPIFTEPKVWNHALPTTTHKRTPDSAGRHTIAYMKRTAPPPLKPLTQAEARRVAALAPIVADALERLVVEGVEVLPSLTITPGPMLAPKDDDR